MVGRQLEEQASGEKNTDSPSSMPEWTCPVSVTDRHVRGTRDTEDEGSKGFFDGLFGD